MPVNKEKNATFTLIITQELHAKLKEMAVANDRSLNKQITYMLKTYIEEHKK
jgi:predicted HicB family RNase H-like nuclease